MPPCWLRATLATAVLAVTPCAARAAVADFLSREPRVDLAVELDYRARFLGPDSLVRDEAPPDRSGRERLDDARQRVAEAYIRQLSDALVEEAIDRVPLVAALERRYEELMTFRLQGRRAARRQAASEPSEPPPALVATASGTGFASDAWIETAALPSRGARGRLRLPPRPEVDDDTELRLRLNGDGATLRVAPTLELSRGRLRARVGYDLTGDRVELSVGRRLRDNASLELTSRAGSDAGVHIGLQFAF